MKIPNLVPVAQPPQHMIHDRQCGCPLGLPPKKRVTFKEEVRRAEYVLDLGEAKAKQEIAKYNRKVAKTHVYSTSNPLPGWTPEQLAAWNAMRAIEKEEKATYEAAMEARQLAWAMPGRTAEPYVEARARAYG
jgi:hypothetical protein